MPRRTERTILLAAGLVLVAGGLAAQATAAGRRVEPVLSLRSRVEAWDWFDDGAPGRYLFGHALLRAGLTQRIGHWQWRVDGALPVIQGLPDDAVQPAPAGPLGLGATYYSANDQETGVAGLFVKQAWLRWAGAGRSLRAGRFEFADGMERAATDPTLAQLKGQRVAQRLIGPFGFSAVGRSFDGAHLSIDRGHGNLTAMYARPTAGAWTVEGGGTLDIDLGYAALTRGRATPRGEHEVRLFGAWYVDDRGTVPADDRPLAVRTADRRPIRIGTYGGHLAVVERAGAATLDALLWGALQRGDWGAQAHRASAFAAEAGLQHRALPWGLWVRGGVFRGSGDRRADDDEHGTFFPLLPTPRIYARFPFYNQMNSLELFATAQVRPTPKLTARAGVHHLTLTADQDLWYGGGGAFDDRVFGYAGRPSGLHSGLGVVTDLSISWMPGRHLALEWYGATAHPGAVPKAIYGDHPARFMYLETTLSR